MEKIMKKAYYFDYEKFLNKLGNAEILLDLLGMGDSLYNMKIFDGAEVVFAEGDNDPLGFPIGRIPWAEEVIIRQDWVRETIKTEGTVMRANGDMALSDMLEMLDPESIIGAVAYFSLIDGCEVQFEEDEIFGKVVDSEFYDLLKEVGFEEMSVAGKIPRHWCEESLDIILEDN